MKSSLLALLLFIAGAAPCFAQNPLAERPSTQKYGWFHNAEWAMNQVLGKPGWTLKRQEPGENGWEYLYFVSNEGNRAIDYRLIEGTIGGITYIFTQDDPEGKAWRTASLEKVSANEWVDRKNLARITRRYNDTFVSYNISFENFAKD